MKVIFNTKWAETLISNLALVARVELETIGDDFLTLARTKGYELKEFRKLISS